MNSRESFEQGCKSPRLYTETRSLSGFLLLITFNCRPNVDMKNLRHRVDL
jgi:hypothetical protein